MGLEPTTLYTLDRALYQLMYMYFSAGSPEPNCSSYPGNVGLWVDALTFVVITLQIVIFDTQYSEMMREYLIERNKKAGE